jgi:hypothetical protein
MGNSPRGVPHHDFIYFTLRGRWERGGTCVSGAAGGGGGNSRPGRNRWEVYLPGAFCPWNGVLGRPRSLMPTPSEFGFVGAPSRRAAAYPLLTVPAPEQGVEACGSSSSCLWHLDILPGRLTHGFLHTAGVFSTVGPDSRIC